MINIPPIKSSSTPATELLSEVTRTWKVGQVLNATSTQSRPANSEVLLQLGKQLLSTRTPVPLEVGQEVKLLVQSLAKPDSKELPLLKLILNEPAQPVEQKATQKLREFIAVQQSLSQLQQTASLLVKTRQALPLPEPLRQSMQQLQQSVVIQGKELNATQIKQLILNSGVFLESKLASAVKSEAPQLVNDLKAQLLKINQQLHQPEIQKLIAEASKPIEQMKLPQQIQQLQQLVQKTPVNDIGKLSQQIFTLLPLTTVNQLSQLLSSPTLEFNVSEELKLLARTLLQQLQTTPRQNLQNLLDALRHRIALVELGQQVEQSINKITSLQLQPLSREADSLVMLLFNLVFKDSHEHFDIQLRLQQESQNEDKQQESWQAVLSFQFKTLGQVQAQIHLLNNRVSTVFHSERAETARKIEELLPLLESGLNKAGLEVISLDVRHQLLDEPAFIRPENHLLDENA